ncbi:MAG TPA: ORF6N domain-containing protein [Bacteroidia bacterium]|nr:ORF6N domain-containing protein [Bacteroidia bacterium]
MNKEVILSDKEIENKIYLVRGQKVMLDNDLAELYEVDTKRLNEQVKRNIDRFPKDFMFQLNEKEVDILRSQFATSSSWGGRRTLPYVFTEHGVLMLSSVLNSPRAVQVNIRIMRIYVKIRELISLNKDILFKLEKIEKNISRHDEEIQLVFKYLKQLLNNPDPPRKKIGYKTAREKQ